MSKRINSFWRLLLGSLIALLGFGSCKTSKKVQQSDEGIVLYGAPPTKVEKQIEKQVERQVPSQEIRLLYGVPPVRRETISK